MSDFPKYPARSRFRPLFLTAILFVLAFDAAFTWQRIGGAYGSEFGGHPDEAAHYVTGLMVRDYVAAGFPGSPLKYAEQYYDHYPKVALGVWPPFFYAVQTAWTLPFTPGRVSMLLLMSCLAAIVAVLIFQALREEYGGWAAGAGALAFLCLPLVREYYGMVMAETLSAATMLAAMLAWGKFLDDGRARDAVWFGVWSGFAILTKGTGLALALAAPLALIFMRRWRLLKRPVLWGSVAIVALIAGPWTYVFRNTGRDKGGWEQAVPSWDWTRGAMSYYGLKLVLALGIVVGVLAVIGVLAKLRASGRHPGRWAAAGGLIVGIYVFQIIIPVGKEARHLIPVLPAAVMFAVAGYVEVCRSLRRLPAQLPLSDACGLPGAILLFALVAVGSVLTVSRGGDNEFQTGLRDFVSLPAKGFSGFREVATTVLGSSMPEGMRSLISSDARGEGMFISEVAMYDRRPTHAIDRASHALATSSWSGAGHNEKFDNDEALFDALTKGKYGFIVIDDTMAYDKRRPYHERLKRLISEHGETFQLAGEYPISRAGEPQTPPIRLYRVLKR